MRGDMAGHSGAPVSDLPLTALEPGQGTISQGLSFLHLQRGDGYGGPYLQKACQAEMKQAVSKAGLRCVKKNTNLQGSGI